MKAAVYARVSTTDQDTARQLDEMRTYAKARKWTVVAEETDKLSGSKTERPGLEKIMSLARSRKIDVVVVQSLDRFGRSLKHLVESLTELDALGVKFVSTSQGFDLTTPSGRAMYGMIAVMAEFERAMIRERILSGLARAKRNGKQLGRKPLALDTRKLAQLRARKVSIWEMSRSLGCSRTAVRTALRAL